MRTGWDDLYGTVAGYTVRLEGPRRRPLTGVVGLVVGIAWSLGFFMGVVATILAH